MGRETREGHPTENQARREWGGMATVAAMTVGCILAIVGTTDVGGGGGASGGTVSSDMAWTKRKQA